MRKISNFLMLALCLTVASLFLPAQSVAAQRLEICQGTYQDVDGDGKPDAIVLQGCNFTTERDTVYVFDHAGNLDPARDWRESVGFEDEIWVFDAGSDGKANLIIDFQRNAGRLIADLYDDQDGSGAVEYTMTNGRIITVESKYPTVRLIAPDGWWVREGKTNYNLDIEVDGPVRTIFNSYVEWIRQAFPSLVWIADGKADSIIQVRDLDYDGRPDYEIRQAYIPVPVEHYIRTELAVNVNDSEVLPEHFIFWPYLGNLADYIKHYGEAAPPVQIKWQTSCIAQVAEFVASRGGESNWFIYSFPRFGPNESNTYANFENPFAFYDLAADQDGYPELAIRNEYAGAYDPVFLFGRFSMPIESIRYSWDQDNDNFWDYKVGLIGRHEITHVVTFPDFTVQTVPYAEYSDWVVNRSWDATQFVSVEGRQYSSSEGIYEGFSREWRDLYITGLVEQPPMEEVQDIRVGLRMEYTPDLHQQPWLYFSPVDRKLHLRHAWGGVWNTDDAYRIRYKDLDGDGYLDQWMFTIHPQPETPAEGESDQKVAEQEPLVETPLKSLQWSHGYLLYGDAELVKLVQSQVPHSLFETLPPRNHEEWLALSKQLERHHKDFAPDDFLGMMAQFQGPTTEIKEARIEDFRLTAGGFRFVLHLRPGFRVLDDNHGLGVTDLPAGSYLITYDGTFRAQPLTQPHIALPPEQLSCDPPAPQQLQWTTIRAVLRNSGLRDCQSLPVRLYVAHEGDKPLLLAEERVAVPGESEYVWEHHWPPAQPGRWTVWVEANTAGAVPGETEIGSMARLELDVAPAPMPQMFAAREAYDGVRFTWPVALLLSSAGLAAVAVLGLILNGGMTGEQEESHQRMPDE
nr:hypothetical protein [Chloroflexota bacterium]